MSAPKRRLGRGLEALLGARPLDPERPDEPAASAALELAVDALEPGPYQPRQSLSEENLAELADSIREQGVLQPLIVRPCRPARVDSLVTHEIVAGERRWRAARIAGLVTVPVVVRELDDQSALAVALIENLQREDLNPIEQARSLARLAAEFGLTHREVAAAVGRSRSSVSNLLRLLDLHDEVKDLLCAGRIDMGHARALLSLEPPHQAAIARRITAGGWSVRRVEQAVQSRLDAPRKAAGARGDPQSRWLEQQIAGESGRQVSIRRRRDGRYNVGVVVRDLDQLHDALREIAELVGRIRSAAGPRAREPE